jgi:hypothetical protein
MTTIAHPREARQILVRVFTRSVAPLAAGSVVRLAVGEALLKKLS